VSTTLYYSVKSRKIFEINFSDVEKATIKNGRFIAMNTDSDGYKLFNILSSSESDLMGFPVMKFDEKIIEI